MRYLIIPILLLLLTALNFLSSKVEKFSIPHTTNTVIVNTKNNQSNFNSENSDSAIEQNTVSTTYYCELKFKPEKNVVIVKSKIIWQNITEFPTKIIYFDFTRKPDKQSADFVADNHNGILDLKFSSSEKTSHLIFIQNNLNTYNKNLSRVDLEKAIFPGDTISFNFEYKLIINTLSDSLRADKNSRIFFDDNWYPRIPIYKNGKWEIYPNSSFTTEFKSFADFNVNITAPSNYQIITSGNTVEKKTNGSLQTLRIEQKQINDFVLIADNEIEKFSLEIKNGLNSNLKVNIYYSMADYPNLVRIENSVKNSLDYLNKNIGNYPNENLTILFSPYKNGTIFNSFSNVITIGGDLFLSKESFNFEVSLAQKIAEQYFHFATENNPQTEAWLASGISKYIGEKIRANYYSDNKASFQFLKYVQVNGLQFLAAKGIPLIYTLGNYSIPQEAISLNKYYSNYLSGSISDSSFLFSNKSAFEMNTIHKPFLMLLSLERIVGKAKLIKIIQEYYSQFKFKYPTGNDFLNIVRVNSNKSTFDYINSIYTGFDYYDLRIDNLTKEEGNKYKLSLRELGNCNIFSEVKVYTEKDTLSFIWNTDEKWKEITFSTKNKVTAAQIDPNRKFIFDSNYANNSYTIERMNWAAISMSIRWFFWIQNVLMILGSAA